MRPRTSTSPWVLAVTLLACTTPGVPGPAVSPAGASVMPPWPPGDGGSGLELRLRTDPEQPAAAEGPPLAEARSLSDAEARRLLDRLPALEPEAADRRAFRLPPDSPPPPRSGRTVEEAFPPDVAAPPPPPVDGGPLLVLRRSPEGAVPLAGRVSVTFSEPMVPLSSHGELSQHDVPVRFAESLAGDPPAGRWRWVGTRTLVFEPEGARLPMATRFELVVPARTTSVHGARLAEDVRWAFRTPPPRLVRAHPHGDSHPLDAVMVAVFDQAVDPRAAWRATTAAAGERELTLSLVGHAELDEAARRVVEGVADDRWVAFRAEGGLPPDTDVVLTFGPMLPSAEGPLKSVEAETHAFRTHGPLRLVRHRCWWGDECPPESGWSLEFSNELDVEAFDEALVRVDPIGAPSGHAPALRVEAAGRHLNVHGAWRARTSYRVTVDRRLTDVFGQRLDRDVSATFAVGPARPRLQAAREGLVVLDPGGPRHYAVHSRGHGRLRVELRAVGPADWGPWIAWQRARWNSDRPSTPGRLVSRDVVVVPGDPDELTEVPVDLAPALESGLGHAIVVVESMDETDDARRPRRIEAWVQSTRLGLSAVADHQQLVAWVTSLADGEARGGVELSISGGGERGASGADGLATMSLHEADSDTPRVLVARDGEDWALLPEHAGHWRGRTWQRRTPGEVLRWFVFDDRSLYRPGETVHLKGWIRVADMGPRGDLERLDDAGRRLAWTLLGARGNELASGSTAVGDHGGFDLAAALPEDANLGTARFRFQLEGGAPSRGPRHEHAFRVQEFRRPEFEVETTTDAGPHVVGGAARARVAASYFAGGPLANAPVRWRVTATETNYRPPGWDGFDFGRWTPWWLPRWGSGSPRASAETLEAATDASGVHRLAVDLVAAEPPLPSTLRIEATVEDVNRQARASSSTVLVHPSDLYVGLRLASAFFGKGERVAADVVVVDREGRAVAGRSPSLRLLRARGRWARGAFEEELEEVGTCAPTSGEDPVPCSFEVDLGGTFRLQAVVIDDQGRRNLTERTVWVAGGTVPPRRDLEREAVELVPEKEEHVAGESARLLVRSPFFPAEGVLTLRRSGLLETRRFSLAEPTTVLAVPIEDWHAPGLRVAVELVGSTPRDPDAPDGPRRPAHATGAISLPVSLRERAVTVALTPAAARVAPGETTTVDVTLADENGRPVPGEVALAVVDEAVLALAGYELPDPLGAMYPVRPAGVHEARLRDAVILAPPSAGEPAGADVQEEGGGAPKEARMAPMSPAPMAMEAAGDAAAFEPAGGPDAAPIRLRTDFDPLAHWSPALAVGADGRATVSVTVPDNLTRYRVVGVAVSGARRFGAGEAQLTARLPLMVRPSPPRFLNHGDAFELPVVLQNQTDEPFVADVALRAAGLSLTGPSGLRARVPADDRVELRFPVRTLHPGTARFQVAAASGSLADAASGELPVFTPATTEAFATYGEIDEGAVSQPFTLPRDAVPEFGELTIATSSTQLQALTDAYLHLVEYPFDCAEQRASRILAVAALHDVLGAFEAEGLPRPEAVRAAVRRDLKALQRLQAPDGSFSLWRRGGRHFPYVSIHVAHALERAGQAGYDIPEPVRDRSRRYLRDVESHFPGWYPLSVRWTLRAYALHVREILGDADPERARALVREAGVEELPLEALGWILPTLARQARSQETVAEIRRHLGNRSDETAATAQFTTSYGDGDWLLMHSRRRTDAVVLEALLRTDPRDDLLPKLVRGLLAHRTRGRWSTTQENAFVLLALRRYFDAHEGVTPDFVARAWLGDSLAGSATYRGRTTERHVIAIPMAYLARGDALRDVVLAKDGPGRLYWRLGLRYAPRDLVLEPADHGFVVERRYEGLDDPNDVTRDAEGAWRVRAGARVRVHVTLVAPARRHHVALVDPLPGGFEPLDPDLAGTGDVPPPPPDSERGPQPWWWGPWYEHQNLRDHRAEAFRSLLWAGVYEHSYACRATTPGRFVVPPPRAEEMYHPETFGRGASAVVIVGD